MTRERRQPTRPDVVRRPWLTGLLVAMITGAYVWLWQVNAEDQCGQPDCLGYLLLLLVLGTPVAVVLLALAFRFAGGSSVVLGVGLIVTAVVVLPGLTASLDPSNVIWPFVLGTIAGGYVKFESVALDA